MKKLILIILIFISGLSFSQENQEHQLKEKSDSLYAKAVKMLDNKDIDGALNHANALINNDPDFTKAYGLRGYISCFYKIEPELAIKDFTKLIQSDSTNAGAFAFRGYSYGYLDKNKEAISDFDSAIKLDSDNLFAHFRRGMCKAIIGDYQKAMNDYDFILNYHGERKSEFSDWATVYSEKANCLNELNRPEDALQLVDQSLKLDESLWHSWLIRGLIYFKMEEFTKCINDMDRVIYIIQEVRESYYYRGISKIKVGINADSCTDLYKAVELGALDASEAIKKYCN